MTITFDRIGTNGFVSLDSYCAENEALRPHSCNAVSLEWKNINYEVPVGKSKKMLIDHMYGRCAPGTLTAIMGPSGAGKTTLMNILSGHIERGYEGEVQVNGCVRDTKLFNMQSCYVMQDDCLLPELTVREALNMSVQLRTPSMKASAREEIEKQHERSLYKINASAILQFGVLLKRCFLCQIRNKIGGPLLMMCLIHWSTSQPYDFHRVAAVVLLAVQTCATSQAIALVVSAASSMQTALFVALPAAAPSFLFCGYFVQVRHLHPAFAWITYTSHVYHAHQGILYAIYGHGREELDCDEDSFCFLSDPREILAKLDAEHAYLSVKFAILLGMDFLLKVVAFFVLKWRLRRKR
ncbi:hypothetical protein HPB51_019149 [Rhipicephalus microplus]|uniref:ABC transporter domain-containing protein n=2 Tax=Rhipicephalus microplus TaxID=6941 RepID=A0A9J6DPW6_RHIMP|nr:hypothetical protein HPB51_019149 [Rhipicephalus microplus]